jgi:hypothetical protein
MQEESCITPIKSCMQTPMRTTPTATIASSNSGPATAWRQIEAAHTHTAERRIAPGPECTSKGGGARAKGQAK